MGSTVSLGVTKICNSGVTVGISDSNRGSIPRRLKNVFGSILVLGENERISLYSFIFLLGLVRLVWRGLPEAKCCLY